MAFLQQSGEKIENTMNDSSDEEYNNKLRLGLLV